MLIEAREYQEYVTWPKQCHFMQVLFIEYYFISQSIQDIKVKGVSKIPKSMKLPYGDIQSNAHFDFRPIVGHGFSKYVLCCTNRCICFFLRGYILASLLVLRLI